MNCRSCSTRIPDGARNCPACGHGIRTTDFRDDPGSSGSESLGPLSPSSLAPRPEPSSHDDVDEVELDQEVTPVPSQVPPKRRPVPKARTPQRPATAGKQRPAPRPKRSPLFSMEPDQLRDLIADQPELIEPGLEIYSDESGREVGVRFATDIGEIDVLATDSDGSLVVIMVSEPDTDRDHVAELLHRIGWAGRHLVQKDEEVRGILLAEEVDDRTSYAAAAVRDTIDIKLYSVALTFDDVEL